MKRISLKMGILIVTLLLCVCASEKPIQASKLKGLKAIVTQNHCVVLTWKKDKKAHNYVIYQLKNKKYKKVKKLSSGKTKFQSTQLKAGTTTWKVQALYGKKKKKSATVRVVIPKENVSKYVTEIPILTFHRFASPEVKMNYYMNNPWVASIDDFECQMTYLYEHGYRTISADEFYDWYMGTIELPQKTVMLTFDDGYYDLYYKVYPILQKYNMKATAFLIGNRIGDSTHVWENTEKAYFLGRDYLELIRSGYPQFEFASHSYGMHSQIDALPLAYTKTYEEFAEDFQKNEEYDFRYIAYPYGGITTDFSKAFYTSGYRLGFGFGKYQKASRKDYPDNISRLKVTGDCTMDQFVSLLK